MIINPIIPIWLMIIIDIVAIVLIVYRKRNKSLEQSKKRSNSGYIANILIKICIIILIFVINLRPMLPNGEATVIRSDLSVLFVVDTSVSMRALDYDGEKERMEGVINDCCYIVDELGSCKYSIITFGDTAQRLIPFTADTDVVQSELKAISLEDDFHAQGTSMNLVKDTLEKTLKNEYNNQNGNSKLVVFFISDGEITKEGENLESFSNSKKYVSNGAVMGYGTQSGGKMVSSLFEDDPTDPSYYITYYDESFNEVTALSKIDETNLRKIAGDLGIDYVQMSKKENIDYKLNNIKQQIANSQNVEDKITAYQDIYYYFAIPLAILLGIDFIIRKRRIS